MTSVTIFNSLGGSTVSAHDDESSDQDTKDSDGGGVSTAEASKDESKDESKEDQAKSSGDKEVETDDDGVPVPGDDAKEKAAEMIKAYEYQPTLVLPGSGKTITGTAVNEWLDDDGNPKFADDEDSPS